MSFFFLMEPYSQPIFVMDKPSRKMIQQMEMSHNQSEKHETASLTSVKFN